MEDAEETRLHPAGPTEINFMRTMVLVLALATAWTFPSLAAEPDTLTTLHAIHSLTKAEARGGLPVAFEATVTYYNRSDVDLFVEEDGEAIYVEAKQNQDLHPGDRVLVRGKTRKSFTLDVLGDSVTLLRHGAPPKPLPTDFEQLIRVERDCMLVMIRATVRSADTVNFGTEHEVYFRLLMDGGYIDATVIGVDASMVKEMLDTDVEVTGVVSGKFDNKMQLVGILLEVPTLEDVRILKRAKVSPDALPITPMDGVLSSSFVRDLTRRVRVQGTITYYQPGSAVVLQNGAKSLWITTHSNIPLRIGDVAVATGFADAREGFLTLIDGEIQDTNTFDPIPPQSATWHQLATWNNGDPDGHQNDLVSFEGQVVASMREDAQDEFVLDSDGKLFAAVYRHPPGNRPIPPMRHISPGTRIRVTGVCMVAQANSISPTEQEVPFNILLRNFDDISVVANPSLLNVRNLIYLVVLLLVLLFAAGVRGWVIERKVRFQNATLAYSERRRSHILEDINGSRPLAEIIEQITEMTSFKLSGVPCWCQIADGAQLGNCPASLTSFRVLQTPIPARSGPPLGTIYAAFDPLIKSRSYESETLSRAAALATLAIETRRLYSDLIHRSEFDLLTDIHNRFSLEKYLDQSIERARETASIFGLIYIDLNDFKQVNDVYGHQFGDLYLQEVAMRMKHQLRSADMPARLGGDEFAVLLPKVRNRSEAAEIVLRLEHCLEEPFTAEGYVIKGSASVGMALYPEDGTTRDALLTAADAAMYVNKNMRRDNAAEQGDHQQPGLSPEGHA